jgi:hypothetical protein
LSSLALLSVEMKSVSCRVLRIALLAALFCTLKVARSSQAIDCSGVPGIPFDYKPSEKVCMMPRDSHAGMAVSHKGLLRCQCQVACGAWLLPLVPLCEAITSRATQKSIPPSQKH